MRAAATYAALIAVSLTIGYWFGIGSTLPISRTGSALQEDTRGSDAGSGSDVEGDSDESDAAPGEDLTNVKAGLIEECKLVRACTRCKRRKN